MNSNLCLINYKPKNLPGSFEIFSSSIRQYFVDKYPHPLFHNHYPDGKSIYRSHGAPFQFKVINNEVFIIALNEGIDFANSFQWPDFLAITLGRSGVSVEFELYSKTIVQANFSESDRLCYRNLSPYIALNQDKHKIFLSLSDDDKRKTIEKGLGNHILTAAKWCGITVSHQIQIDLILMRPGCPIKIKDNLNFLSFDVMFESNTEIPNYIGLGKFVSRGYGTVIQYG